MEADSQADMRALQEQADVVFASSTLFEVRYASRRTTTVALSSFSRSDASLLCWLSHLSPMVARVCFSQVPVLKVFAEPLLRAVPPDNEAYPAARSLVKVRCRSPCAEHQMPMLAD